MDISVALFKTDMSARESLTTIHRRSVYVPFTDFLYTAILIARRCTMDKRQDEVVETGRIQKEPYSPPEVADLGEVVGFTGS